EPKGKSRSGFAMQNVSRRNAIMFGLLAAVSPLVPSTAAEPVPLAISGYDPVAYFTMGKPARGLPEIEFEWDEHRYRFVSAEHRELFRADPVRYAPQFAHFCAMSLARGELVEADPESFLISDGKLYLFGKAVGPRLFQQDLAGYVTRANEHHWMLPKH